MYKPQTIEQFRVYQYMQKHFEMDAVILSPLSRHSLMLEDMTGAKIAFSYENAAVREIPIPAPLSPEQVHEYLLSVKGGGVLPFNSNYKEATKWWLNTPNPLTYQQALGLTDKPYRHFLTRPMLDEKKVIRLAKSGLVTELEFLDMWLWYYLNRPRNRKLMKLDGCDPITAYVLIIDFMGDNETGYEFAVKDEAFCRKYKHRYPYE